MFGRFRQKTIVIEKKFEIPTEIITKINNVDRTKGSEAKEIFIEYLKGLDRVDFLRAGDAWPKIWNHKHYLYDWIWEAYSDREWDLEFPSTKKLYDLIASHSYETSPIVYKRPKENGREINLDLNKLENTVYGMQKKIDRIQKLFETAEFKLSGKDALKL